MAICVADTNIFVDADDRVQLVDFGLALGFAEASGAGAIAEDACRTRSTRRDMVVGTTHYMAPEQLMGHEIDMRSDVFALAVTGDEASFGPRRFPRRRPTIWRSRTMRRCGPRHRPDACRGGWPTRCWMRPCWIPKPVRPRPMRSLRRGVDQSW